MWCGAATKGRLRGLALDWAGRWVWPQSNVRNVVVCQWDLTGLTHLCLKYNQVRNPH